MHCALGMGWPLDCLSLRALQSRTGLHIITVGCAGLQGSACAAVWAAAAAAAAAVAFLCY